MNPSPPPEPDASSARAQGHRAAQIRSSRAARWVRGTAGKAFLIMMLALLPLAIATMIASWHSIRSAEQARTALLQTAARQNALQLASDINAIRTAQSMTANVLASEAHPGAICERTQSLFNAMTGDRGIAMAMIDRSGRIRCQSAGGAGQLAPLERFRADTRDVILSPELDGLLIRSISRDGAITGFTLYRRGALQALTSTRTDAPDQSIVLRQGDRNLVLAGAAGATARRTAILKAQAKLEGYDLVLVMRIADSAPLGARIVPLLMPLLLWVAAVFLGWLVVRWILIQPLMALRREVSAYVPGKVMHPPPLPRLASSEIVELGESFHAMSEDVAEHEEEMRTALARQMKLTREVHHRVKNNLQIISSLISLHWRAANDPKAADAYLSIQRRVDALAVVQRNHYAALDEQRGVRARPMMNEIASGLKISAQVQSGRNIDIAVDCDDVSLHQDVAAPIAFMTAELADLVIELDTGGCFTISLIRLDDDPARARFALVAPVFRQARAQENGTVALYERVLSGLSRQLRTPLGHDAARGEYHIIVPIIG